MSERIMTQDEINQGEWNNGQNWSIGIYRSKADSRPLVPKRRGFGWTLNFGNPNGRLVFFALLSVPLVIFAAIALVCFFGKR